jgi:hypothetical protein
MNARRVTGEDVMLELETRPEQDALTDQDRRSLTAFSQRYAAQACYGISRETACRWLFLRWVVSHDRLGAEGE